MFFEGKQIARFMIITALSVTILWGSNEFTMVNPTGNLQAVCYLSRCRE
jgi:hypothetical protein